jgi:hypothetical protein
MKILDVPQSGHLGTFVSYKTRYGQFRRAYTVPADPKSPAQLLRRARMGRVAAGRRTLADIQRAAWNASGGQVQSHSQLGRSGPLKGYNLYMKINSNLADLGENPVFDPPDFPQFSENLIGDLTIANIGGVIALKLSVPATPVRHTLVLATRPGSPGSLLSRTLRVHRGAARAGRGVQRHHRAVSGPLRRPKARYADLHPHPAADQRLEGHPETNYRCRSGRLSN